MVPEIRLCHIQRKEFNWIYLWRRCVTSEVFSWVGSTEKYTVAGRGGCDSAASRLCRHYSWSCLVIILAWYDVELDTWCSATAIAVLPRLSWYILCSLPDVYINIMKASGVAYLSDKRHWNAFNDFLCALFLTVLFSLDLFCFFWGLWLVQQIGRSSKFYSQLYVQATLLTH